MVWLIIDILLALCMALMIFTGYRQGLLGSLLRLAGFFVAVAAAAIVSAKCAPYVYSAFIKTGLVEAVAEQKLLNMLPEELRGDFAPAITPQDPEICALVKAADKLSAYLKCVEEVKAGNAEFKKAKEQTWAALARNPLPALQYFMEHFLKGFELTLDELS